MRCCQKKGERLLKIGCKLLKRGSLSEGKKKKKKAAMGDSDLQKGVNVATHPVSPIFSECSPPPGFSTYQMWVKNNNAFRIRKHCTEFHITKAKTD